MAPPEITQGPPRMTTLTGVAPPTWTIVRTIANFGSITTRWSAPASCSTTSAYNFWSGRGDLCMYSREGGREVSCWPSISGIWTTGLSTYEYSPLAVFAYYSPHYSPAVCPSGWAAFPTREFYFPFAFTTNSTWSIAGPDKYMSVCCPP